MAADTRDDQRLDKEEEKHTDEKPRNTGNKQLLIIIVLIILACAGGAFIYLQFFTGKSGAQEQTAKKPETKPVLIALDPFVLNLSEQGRFLKVSLQFEVADASRQTLVVEMTPQLRDAIITLVSSKSAESVSTPEGKFQLKDEILLRANRAMGQDVTFKNLYFTEFVMQ